MTTNPKPSHAPPPEGSLSTFAIERRNGAEVLYARGRLWFDVRREASLRYGEDVTRVVLLPDSDAGHAIAFEVP